MVTAFNAEGPGQLEAKVGRRAVPVSGESNATVVNVLALACPGLALIGMVLLGLAWRGWPADAGGLPRAGIFAALGVGVFSLLPLVMPGWLFMALFAMASRRSSTSSRSEASNTGAIGSASARSPPDSPEAQAALERYKVGRTGPVFYDPANPKEAVLERDAPASAAVMYGIAAGVMLVGGAIVVAFTRASDVVAWLQPWFPPGAFVPGVLFFVAAGVLTTLFLVSSLRRSLASARWPTTTGKVLSSIAEPYRSFSSGTCGTTVEVWSPVVGYTYRVAGQEYHGSRIAFGADVAASREFAQAITARYPAGSEVIVNFDPHNPSFALLEPRVAFAWWTLLLTVAFFAAAWFFSR
jgi:hypothetical protein